MNDPFPSEPGFTASPYLTPIARPATNGLAIAALVLGVWSIVVGIVPLVGLVLTLVPTVLAVVFGIIGAVRASRGAPNGGMAVTGIVLGSVAFLLYFVGFGTFW